MANVAVAERLSDAEHVGTVTDRGRTLVRVDASPGEVSVLRATFSPTGALDLAELLERAARLAGPHEAPTSATAADDAMGDVVDALERVLACGASPGSPLVARALERYRAASDAWLADAIARRGRR